MRRAFRYVGVILLAVLCLTGCAGGMGFQRNWRSTRDVEWGSPIAGVWQGTWESDVNGHRGKLRAVITPAADGTYLARFRATYWGIFRFGMRIPLSVTEQDGVAHFEGEANLGWLAGGMYHYSGQADGHDFLAGYSAKRDHGRFVLHRPVHSHGPPVAAD